jgi:uncharacterized protein with von Willebrand factor type A (vWA) domain
MHGQGSFAGPMDPRVANWLGFLRGLRRLGFSISVEEERLVFTALEAVGWEDPGRCRDAVRAVVVKRPQQLRLFLVAWRQFLLFLKGTPEPWLAQNTLLANVARMRHDKHSHPEVVWMGRNNTGTDAADEDSDEPMVFAVRGASREERLRHKDFARMTPAELEETRRLRPRVGPLWKRSRRMGSVADGEQVDFARTMEQCFRTGEFVPLSFLERQWKQRPVVFLCDVSGSMDPYSRMLIRFAHTVMQSGIPIETFVFSTRLTWITRALQVRDPDQALAEVSQRVADLSGGTRLADALATFRRDHAPRVLRRGAVAVLATDGLDTGCPEELEREVHRLRRLSHRLFWLNPLLGDKEFRLEAPSLRRIRPYVDEMLPAHNFASLERAWLHIQECHNWPRVPRQGSSV